MNKKLKEILDGCLFTDGDWIESKDQDPKGEIRLIQLADIGDGNFIDKSSRFINRETALKLKCTFLKKGDVLIARMPDPLGRACVFPLEEENKYVTAVDVCIIRPNEKCLASYLKYTLNSTDIRNTIARQKTGTTRERITRKKLGDLQIPLPPLPTQQKIASILDAADTLRQKDKALLAKYDELTQALFLDMFGDPVSNPKGWEVKKLKDFINKLNTGVSVNSEEASDVPGKYFILKTSCVYSGIFNPKQVKIIREDEIHRAKLNPQKDTIIISRMNTSELVGKSAYIFNDYPNIYLPDRLWQTEKTKLEHSVLWLSYNIGHKSFMNEISKISSGTSGSMKNISKSSFLELKSIYPSLSLQTQFSERVTIIEKQKAIAQASLEKSEELFNSLLQKAFKGELL